MFSGLAGRFDTVALITIKQGIASVRLAPYALRPYGGALAQHL